MGKYEHKGVMYVYDDDALKRIDEMFKKKKKDAVEEVCGRFKLVLVREILWAEEAVHKSGVDNYYYAPRLQMPDQKLKFALWWVNIEEFIRLRRAEFCGFGTEQIKAEFEEKRKQATAAIVAYVLEHGSQPGLNKGLIEHIDTSKIVSEYKSWPTSNDLLEIADVLSRRKNE